MDVVDLLRNGRVREWNEYRSKLPEIHCGLEGLGGARLTSLHGVNLEGVDFHNINLSYVDFSRAILRNSDLRQASLASAQLSNCDLTGANLEGALLFNANLAGAKLARANLRKSNLGHGNLSLCDLSGACLDFSDLTLANMARTKVQGASFRNCRVYGLSAWDLVGVPGDQTQLVITYPTEPSITADSLEVAQFVYLLLHNQKIGHIIETITTKVVLILGRFTPDQKPVLEALRHELPKYNYVPVVFDFDVPATRDSHETITTLARLARFVIADITDAKSIPQELVSVVEQLPSVPVQPILRKDAEPWGMWDHIQRYPSVLELCKYVSTEDLIVILRDTIIDAAEARIRKGKRSETMG